MRYTIAPENCTRCQPRSNILLYDETYFRGFKWKKNDNDMKNHNDALSSYSRHFGRLYLKLVFFLSKKQLRTTKTQNLFQLSSQNNFSDFSLYRSEIPPDNTDGFTYTWGNPCTHCRCGTGRCWRSEGTFACSCSSADPSAWRTVLE
jgi:hypothetical protein